MVKKDKSTPENVAFWDAVEKAHQEVETWPAWKRGFGDGKVSNMTKDPTKDPKPKEPEYDRDAVIERLLSEVRQCRKIIEEIELVFKNAHWLDGLSLTGAARAVLKRYNDTAAEVERLNREIVRIVRKGDKNGR